MKRASSIVNRMGPSPPVYPLRISAYSSSPENIRAPCSADSKMPSETLSFPSSTKISGPRVRFQPEWNPRSQDYWSDVLPEESLLRMSNSG
ncbi:hypothetical protein DY000_02031575 [Brassica cretica]|uniref:Uncharacterized protein n=1 Tax=Brassica cretica TaxID=69181 RepID=A0ABQ7DPT8_BRACR|nr:hypothetical protein DY000_02031575 [Brassica cretica]